MQAAEAGLPFPLSCSLVLLCQESSWTGLPAPLHRQVLSCSECRTVNWPVAPAVRFMTSSGGGYLPTQGKLKQLTRLRQNRHLMQKLSNVIRSISDPDIWSTSWCYLISTYLASQYCQFNFMQILWWCYSLLLVYYFYRFMRLLC